MKIEPNNIYLGDAYKLIKDIPDKSVDLIITDPPYEIETEGGNTNIGKSYKNGLMKDFKEFENITKGIDFAILDEFMRVMKKPNIYIWCNKKQIPDYLDYFVQKHKCSFEILVWIKENPTPLCGGNYLIDKEFCLYFRKGVKLNTTFNTAHTYWITKTNIGDKKDYAHPTIKPVEIIKMLIENSSERGGVVLDCFLGSGTTAVACKELGRQYIGFELNEKYYNIAKDRLNGINQKGQMNLFETDFDKVEQEKFEQMNLFEQGGDANE